MINFDAMDFRERRPEEVISFFWRSVYVPWFHERMKLIQEWHKQKKKFHQDIVDSKELTYICIHTCVYM